jgi:hypothetical protein
MKFLAFPGLADSDQRMIRGSFLGQEDRNKLIALARDTRAASRVTRRANALALLGDGWNWSPCVNDRTSPSILKETIDA